MIRTSVPAAALLAAGVWGLAGAGPAVAQDALQAAAAFHRLLLENEHVRVLEVRVKPGANVPLHEHPAYVAYIVRGGRAKFTAPDGAVEVLEHKDGVAAFKEAEKHAFENVGTTELQVVLFELKPRASRSPALPAAPEGTDAVKACTDCARVLAENDRVRLYEVTLRPGQKTARHVHPANVVYAISDVRARFTLADGKAVERTLPAGTAVWAEPVEHEVENIGSTEARFLHLDLKPTPAAK